MSWLWIGVVGGWYGGGGGGKGGWKVIKEFRFVNMVFVAGVLLIRYFLDCFIVKSGFLFLKRLLGKNL